MKQKKSKKHKDLGYEFLGFTFLGLVFAAALAAVYYLPQPKSASDVETQSLPVSEPPKTLSYQNDDYGFKFDYDKDYTLSTSGQEPNFFQFDAKTVVSVAIPLRSYPDTNFGSARATIAVQTDSVQSACERKRDMEGLDGAAAGTRYKTRVFRDFNNDNCYEISFTVGIANIQNYEPGMVTAVDETDVWNKIMAVMSNFEFTN